MRFLIAPDKYKGTLTAREAAEAMARGVRAACAERNITPEIDLCPLSDGGEGFLDVMAEATGASIEHLGTTDPVGNTISVPVGFIGGGHREAIVESALVIGLQIVPVDKRIPEQLSTRGLGTLLVDLARKGCTKITVGLGGSATIDGGIGMASALGDRFLDAHNNERPAIGASLTHVARIERLASNPLAGVEIVAACDVDSPLLGEHGAARTYGPQKGATPAQAERLDAGLANLARLAQAPALRCAGAAGGLGFGVAAFAGATLTSGSLLVIDTVRFAERAARADLVLTGEGSLDRQTAKAKVCASVAQRSSAPVCALPGQFAPNADTRAFALVHPCAPFDAPPPSSTADAAGRLTRAARDAVLSFLPS